MFLHLVSIAPYALLGAEDLVVLGKKGLVYQALVADGALEAFGAGVPIPLFIGQPRVLQSDHLTARLRMQERGDGGMILHNHQIPFFKHNPVENLTFFGIYFLLKSLTVHHNLENFHVEFLGKNFFTKTFVGRTATHKTFTLENFILHKY